MSTKNRSGWRFAFAMMVVLAGAGVLAETTEFTLDEGLSGTVVDWTKGESYVGGAAPSPDIRSSTTVNVPSGMVVRVTVDTIDGMKDLLCVNPGMDAEICFELNDDKEIACQISQGSGRQNRPALIRKKGTGKLKLSAAPSSGPSYYYAVAYSIENGTVEFPITKVTNGAFYYCETEVGVNGALLLARGARNFIRGLTGDGVVSASEGTGSPQLFTDGGTSDVPAVFAGYLTGDVIVRNSGYQFLTSTASDNVGIPKIGGGVLSVESVGMTGNASSLGSSYKIQFYSGTLEKSGEAFEVTDKAFELYGDGTLSGGMHGGLSLTGDVRAESTAGADGRTLTVESEAGSATCFLSNSISVVKGSGYANLVNLVKGGGGTWLMGPGDHAGLRQLTVKDGVMAYDSFADDAPYALQLGAAASASTGLVSYVGSEVEIVATRPTTVGGNGGFLNSGSGMLRYTGVSPTAGSEEKTLFLDGTSTRENDLTDVTNDVGKTLSVVKRGSGTWCLGGDLTFGGDLKVEEGTLVVRNDAAGSPFTRFRIQLKENCARKYPESYAGSYATRYYFYLYAIGLYDSERNRVAVDPSVASDYMGIEEGQVAPVNQYKLDWSEGCSLSAPFSSTRTAWTGYFRNADGSQSKIVPLASDPTMWMTIDVRIPEPEYPVTSIDFSSAGAYKAKSGAWGRNLLIFNVLGSRDGLSWTQLFDTDVEVSTNNIAGGMWNYDGASCLAGDELTKRSGFPFDHASTTRSCSVLENVRSVSVAKGAVLKSRGSSAVGLKNLVVDANGAGTIEGFALEADGTLKIDNAESLAADGQLPLTFVNCTGFGENLASWSVTAGDKVKNWKLKYANGKISVVKSGLMLLVR